MMPKEYQGGWPNDWGICVIRSLYQRFWELFLVVLKVSGTSQMIFILTTLNFACPCGVNVVVYPAAFGQDTRPGAGVVLVSSMLAVFTIPLLYALACR